MQRLGLNKNVEYKNVGYKNVEYKNVACVKCAVEKSWEKNIKCCVCKMCSERLLIYVLIYT